jgi:diguanylate cyclase (GGDEF)-like protein/PAS domain S-box-containing protein
MTQGSSHPQKKKISMERSNPVFTSSLSDAQIIHTIMDNSQDTVYFKDSNSVFILNSKAHAQQFGLEDPTLLIGKSDADFYPENFIRNALHDEREIMKIGIPILGRVEKWEKDNGDVVWFSASKYPLYDDDGKIAGTWGTSRDISALKNAEQELERLNKALALANTKLKELSVVDELSGLYNRRNFYDTLHKTAKIYARVRSRGLSATFALILLDIDYFKKINDTFGHLVGDHAIRHIGHLLTTHTRVSDYTFRYGGDEFAIILPDTDITGGKELAERLRLVVEKNPMVLHGEEVKLTISLGVSSYTDQIVDAMEMVQDADARLYESKNRGRNLVS